MDPIDHLKDSAQGIRLSREAAERMRTRLEMHMREHPVAEPVHSPYHRFSIRSPFLSWLRRPVAALMLILLVGFGGATSYAAAGALPGEPLYAVKVNVIEPMKGLLAVSPEAKAVWHVSVAETRVKEVEQLTATDKLTPERGAKVQKGFDQSLEEARATIQTISRGNPEAAAKIERNLTATLDAREAALTSLAVTATSTNATEARSFAEHVKNKVHGKVKGASDGKNGQGSGKDRGASDEVPEEESDATSTPVIDQGEDAPEADQSRGRGSKNGLMRSLDL